MKIPYSVTCGLLLSNVFGTEAPVPPLAESVASQVTLSTTSYITLDARAIDLVTLKTNAQSSDPTVLGRAAQTFLEQVQSTPPPKHYRNLLEIGQELLGARKPVGVRHSGALGLRLLAPLLTPSTRQQAKNCLEPLQGDAQIGTQVQEALATFITLPVAAPPAQEPQLSFEDVQRALDQGHRSQAREILETLAKSSEEAIAQQAVLNLTELIRDAINPQEYTQLLQALRALIQPGGTLQTNLSAGLRELSQKALREEDRLLLLEALRIFLRDGAPLEAMGNAGSALVSLATSAVTPTERTTLLTLFRNLLQEETTPEAITLAAAKGCAALATSPLPGLQETLETLTRQESLRPQGVVGLMRLGQHMPVNLQPFQESLRALAQEDSPQEIQALAGLTLENLDPERRLVEAHRLLMEGTPQSILKACQCYQELAAEGNPEAQYELAHLLSKPDIQVREAFTASTIPERIREAVRLYQLAAAHTPAGELQRRAAFAVAKLLWDEGAMPFQLPILEGATRNDRHQLQGALRYYRQARSLGHEDTQASIHRIEQELLKLAQSLMSLQVQDIERRFIGFKEGLEVVQGLEGPKAHYLLGHLLYKPNTEDRAFLNRLGLMTARDEGEDARVGLYQAADHYKIAADTVSPQSETQKRAAFALAQLYDEWDPKTKIHLMRVRVPQPESIGHRLADPLDPRRQREVALAYYQLAKRLGHTGCDALIAAMQSEQG